MLRTSGRSRAHYLVLVFGLTAALMLAACGDDDDSGSGDSGSDSAATDTGGSAPKQEAPKQLINEGEFSLCIDPSYPPLESLDESGEFIGFDVEVAKAVAESWGVEPTFKNTAFSGILPALDSGRCDVAWSGLFIDPERTKAFGAVPFQDTASVIMVKAGNPEGIKSPEDLAGKTVVSQSGSNLLKLAKKISADNEKAGLEASNVQGYERFNEAIQQLAVGRADAVITQDIDAAVRDKKTPGQFEIAYTFPNPETFAVYYKPDKTELGDKIYESLKQLEESGELKKIAEAESMPANGIAVEKPVGPN
jgi:polar amino acid transport system substrate-binding protein